MNFSKFTELGYHHHNPVSATFITLNISLRRLCSQRGSQTMNELLSVALAFPLLGISYKGNRTINIVFWLWLLSFNIMFFKLIDAVACISSFIAESYSIV